MESRMFTFVLLCVVWSNVVALDVKIPEQVYEVASGSDATIPCQFTTEVQNPRAAIITWFRLLNSTKSLILTYYYPDKVFDVAESPDAKRFSIEADFPTGKADLLLKSVTPEDNTTYECRVQIQGDAEGTNTNSATLMVLTPPSTPVCEVRGSPKNGEDIQLVCESKEASPAAQYKWESRDDQNTLRDLDPKSADSEGILSLFGITQDTSGTYICTSSNKVGSANCSLTLSVTP